MSHVINQMAYKAKYIRGLTEGHYTLKSLEEVAIALMLTSDFDNNLLFEQLINQNYQFRY